MSLPKGPFKRIEFIAPEKLAQGEIGRIIIHTEPAIEIEPESLYYYLLIQIVAETQKKYPKKFKNGVSPGVVLHYLKQINEIVLAPRKIKTVGSLKHAWRKHIRKGTQYRFYGYNKAGREELELHILDKANFMDNQFALARKVSQELPFKINIINPAHLIFRRQFLPTLKPHDEAGESEPESATIIDKYIKSLSTDFRIRNIPFLGQYKDMLDDEVYIQREFTRPSDALSYQGKTRKLDLGTATSDPCRHLLTKRKTLIEGEPGSGKTVLLHNIALNLATNFNRDHLIPLYVEIRGYCPSPDQTLYNYAIDIACKNANFTQGEELEFEASVAENKDSLVYLLDGYDEASSNPEVLNKILSLPGASKIIMTSRKYGPDVGFAPDLRVELKPFDRVRKRLFVEKAACIFDIQQSVKDKLLMDIGGFSSVADVAQNPFFLLCICFAARSGIAVPSRRIDLLREVQAGLLDHFLNKLSKYSQDDYTVIKYVRHITHDGVNIFDSIYSRLAFYHFSQAELEFSEPSIVNLVETVAQEYNLSEYRFELKNTVLNCGLLITGNRQGSYSFVHPLFMEYFAAQQLSNTTSWKEIVLNKYVDPSWRNMILFFIAQSGVIKFPEIYKLLTHHDDYFYNGLLLAAESISELAEYPPQTEEIIDALGKILYKHPLNYVFIDSLFRKKTGLPYSSSKTFFIFTAGPDFNRPVVESLVKRGAAPYLDKCVEAMFVHSVGCFDFHKLVSHYGKQIGPETLAVTLLEHDYEQVRIACAFALGLIASDLAENKLIETLLRPNKYLDVRLVAMIALGDIGSSRSIEALIRVLANDEDNSSLRIECAHHLRSLNAHQAVSTLLAVLSKPSDDPKDRQVRLACARALRDFGVTEALAPFMHCLTHDTYAYLRAECAIGLAGFGNKRAMDKLLEILGNPKEHPEVRAACAKALCNYESEEAVNKLTELLADPNEDWSIRSECAEALASEGNDKGAEQLVGILGNPNEDFGIRIFCARTLKEIRLWQSVPNIENILKDILVTELCNPNADSRLRSECLTLLREIGSPQIDKILTFVTDPDCDEILRRTCITELGELRSSEALPKLSHVLMYDHNDYMRELSAWALGNIGSHESIEKLKEQALMGDNFTIRKACIQALGIGGSELAASTLVSIVTQLLQKNEQEIAWSALRTLGTIPTETSLDFSIMVLKKRVDEMKKDDPNQLCYSLHDIPGNELHTLLYSIHTLSHQLNKIVSPQSLGLSDVVKE
ncbi:MAG: HEAT repeat domain-containing protein [Thermodesulfobacteriota bacterium]|jgi:HEAT repeat protein